MTEIKSLEIRKEKRKTEKLLHEMLPKSMAYRLQKGEQICAEQFQCVTVFFSDIADFTEISINSAPIDIVRFLNDVYNFIDSQIVKYDVYKVETIGCVYMVSSGIPSRNGDRHCAEISRLSIDLIQACDEFVIPHMQTHKLQLRIGVHTGPVVGGIVGNKMPRYCLFGDTVNTASRMQSNGLPHRIHISQATDSALQKIGGFETKLRGEINVKVCTVLSIHSQCFNCHLNVLNIILLL
ncbi:hypothetical protein HELRODRAFT_77993 [Helobdella robusta]|uniref:Guanylate cyclase domain-containing protein n=1 Tax=Helobdella robusta TaxID=6412 RepID=T1G362_HELRO|nr:hypothetical protein HELRODRAFT_77993 [Helobdella robusta]ESO05234.1 hypothetical protein HELRODRAFT_77993 [Helobdella robusta]